VLSLIGLAGVLVLKTSIPRSGCARRRHAYAIVALLFGRGGEFRHGHRGHLFIGLGLRICSSRAHPWSLLLLATIAPVAVIGMLIPELFFAKFRTFLAFLGVGFAPLCGIQIATTSFCVAAE